MIIPTQHTPKKRKFLLLFSIFIGLVQHTLYSELPLEATLFDSDINFIFSDHCRKRATSQDDSFIPSDTARAFNKKPWTFIIYIAADNDLRNFAIRNIKQMSNIGSNEYINIVVHIDIRVTGNYKITRRYYIDKNQIVQLNTNDPYTQQMDSGDPKTLISCCAHAIDNFPADNYALIFWDHGSGILDPVRGRIINPSELFTFNPVTSKFELDRTIGFFDLINYLNKEQKGICWDDSTGNYLNNQKLDSALHEIYTKLLHNHKLKIIGFDACLMAMLEVANITKHYAEIMLGSQEVELGTGWDYEQILQPFQYGSLDPIALAKHMVNVYEKTYSNITNDFTQSALDLLKINAVEENIHKLALHLLECFKHQRNNSVKNAIKTSRNKFLCTHFDEPTYLDLYHLYANIEDNLRFFQLPEGTYYRNLKQDVERLLKEGKQLISNAVIANTCGKSLSQAHGVSIYFPERSMHTSYPISPFASNAWITFLKQYLTL
jgi:hypothetical protein